MGQEPWCIKGSGDDAMKRSAVAKIAVGVWATLLPLFPMGDRLWGGAARKRSAYEKAASPAMAVLLATLLAACQSETLREKLGASTPPPSQNQGSENSEPAAEPNDGRGETLCEHVV